jgi:vacuolar protein sorting-associated protein 13B
MSDPIYINTDLKRTISQSYALPIDGHLQVNMSSEFGVIQLMLTSSIENKMRTIIASSTVVAINHTKYDLKIHTFATEISEKIEGLKRNEIPIRTSQILDKSTSKLNKLGHPVISFADLSSSKVKRKFNSTFNLFFAISLNELESSIPIKIQPVTRQSINVFNYDLNISLAISIIKHNEQFFISIQEDKNPILIIRNNTDFDLYIAETNFSNSNAKSIQPHKEINDDRIHWFQTAPKKQKVFYTPPIINENFPEISSPEFGLTFACVTGNDVVRWSQPIKIDGTKKIIINVPMFGDLRLDVNVEEKSWIVTINYIQQLENDDIRSTPDREFYRSQPNQSLVEVKNNYKKTFLLNQSRKKKFNLNIYLQQISLTISTEKSPIISLNIEDIALRFSKLSCKMNINFSRIQVDNELFSTGDYDFPVVLCNKDIPKRKRQELTSIWDLTEFLDQTNDDNYEIEIDFYDECHGIENIFIKLLPIRAYIEDTYINKFLQIIDDCLPHNLILKNEYFIEKLTIDAGKVLLPKMIIDQFSYLSDPVRIRTLRIEPLHVLISVHTCMR